jgi:hypothetical protein
MRSFITCTLHQVSLHDQVKENDVGTAWRTNGGEKECI